MTIKKITFVLFATFFCLSGNVFGMKTTKNLLVKIPRAEKRSKAAGRHTLSSPYKENRNQYFLSSKKTEAVFQPTPDQSYFSPQEIENLKEACQQTILQRNITEVTPTAILPLIYFIENTPEVFYKITFEQHYDFLHLCIFLLQDNIIIKQIIYYLNNTKKSCRYYQEKTKSKYDVSDLQQDIKNISLNI